MTLEGELAQATRQVVEGEQRSRSELRRGTAIVIEERVTIEAIAQRMTEERGEAIVQRTGFVATNADSTTRIQVPRGTTFIEIRLSPDVVAP